MAATLYLDDLAVGQVFATGAATLTADEIKAFAADFDPQPFHLDEAAARQSVFGALAASGWHTGALSMRLLVQGELRLAGGLIGLGGELSWARPVHAGDTLRVESEVLDIRVSTSKPDRGIVTVRNRTLNQRGEVVQAFVVKMLVPRRPAA
jgi:acyl dehydratase